MFAQFHEPLGPVADDLRDARVTGWPFIEGGTVNLAIHRALEIRDFLGALIDQQKDEVRFRGVGENRQGDVFQQHRLSRARRCHDQPALPASERRNEIDRTRRDRLDLRILEDDSLRRMQRRQMVELLRLRPRFRRNPFDGQDTVDRHELLPGRAAPGCARSGGCRCAGRIAARPGPARRRPAAASENCSAASGESRSLGAPFRECHRPAVPSRGRRRLSSKSKTM